mgnify:CR=1 FL=1
MEKKKFHVGIYDDDEKLLHAVEEIQKRGFKVFDAYTPFPIHGLDHVLGIKRTRLTVAAFMFGMTGFATALSMQIYMM